jgi:hemerythrin-like metal-binding protein
MFESPSAGKALADVAHQHARLAQNIATVRHTLDQGGEWTGLAAQLDELIGVLSDHFTDEEALMTSRQYPGTADHRQQHSAILLRVRTLREQCETGQSELAPVLLDFIHNSLERHEATADQAFEQYIAELG